MSDLSVHSGGRGVVIIYGTVEFCRVVFYRISRLKFGYLRKSKRGVSSANALPDDTGVFATGFDTLLNHTGVLGTQASCMPTENPNFRVYPIEHHLGINVAC